MTSARTSKHRIAVAMLGARRHYAVPRILHESGQLARFFTDLSSNTGLLRAFGVSARKAESIPAGLITHFPLLGVKQILRSRLNRSPADRIRGYLAGNREFCRRVAAQLPADCDAVYGFNGAALEILEAARGKSLKTVLDQTAAPWAVEETLLAEERQRWPGWEFESAASRNWKSMAEREEREWALADAIVCGSDYVRQGLLARGGPTEKCAVVPYGLDPGLFRSHTRSPGTGPLRILIAGTVQLRKGIQYLLEAAKILGKGGLEIRAVGMVCLENLAVRELGEWMDLRGPVPQSQMQAEYDWADILALPSISEGSANVCYEALACGVPVITTPNAGSVVRDGIDGFIVPIRSGDLLAERIRRLQSDRNLLEEMSRNTVLRSAAFTRAEYARTLLAAIEKAFTP